MQAILKKSKNITKKTAVSSKILIQYNNYRVLAYWYKEYKELGSIYEVIETVWVTEQSVIKN